MPEYKLPDVGEGLTEAEIVTWKVKVGDVIAINDIVVEIETAKSLVELPSPYAGTVTGLLVPEGETVAVGTPIIAIAAEGEAPAPAPAAPAATPQADLGEIDLSNPARERWRRGREPGRPQQGRARLPAPAAQGHLARGGRRAALDPRAGRGVVRPGRAGLAGGRRGRRAGRPGVHARGPGACRPPTATSAPWPSLRSASWPRTSASTSPRWSAPATVAWSRARTSRPRLAHRVSMTGASAPSSTSGRERETPRAHQGRPQDDGAGDGRLGLLRPARHRVGHRRRDPDDGVRRPAQGPARVPRRQGLAAARAGAGRACWPLRRTPEINSFWDERAQEVVFKHYVNLGIAAATARGLVVPNVKDAQDLSLLDLAGALNQLTATARDGKTQPADMSGGTFTITNVGVFGDRLRHPDHQPGRVRDPGLRRGAQDAVGRQWSGRGRHRRAAGDHARAVLRPPSRRRREGLALPGRRRRDHGGPGRRAAVLTLIRRVAEGGKPSNRRQSMSRAARPPVPRPRARATGRCVRRRGVARSHARVSRAVSATGRTTRPAWREASWSWVIIPSYSGRGSHSGSAAVAHPGLDLLLGEELLARPHDVRATCRRPRRSRR